VSESGKHAWVGDAPSWPQACATLYGGIAALMIGGVQPLVFGALVGAGRIGLADLGRIATLESLGMAAGATLGPLLMRRLSARWLGFAAALTIVAGSAAMPEAQSASPLYALRGAIGVAEGALLSLTIALIARAPAPERWSGAFLGVQTLTQSAGAWAVPALLAPHFGANGGFVLLGGMAALACIASVFAARELAPVASRSVARSGRVPPVAWIGLGFILVSLASSSAIWSYFERLGDARGLTPEFIGSAAAASLLSQAIGSFAATLVGPRLRWLGAVAISALAQLAALAALQSAPGGSSYIVAGAVFGFFWLFAMPYQVRALVEIDPSRSSARLIASAQILGGALGPLAASALVRGGTLAGVLVFAAVATAAAFALAGLAKRMGRRGAER
jgi:predicted MFS family arabinose efflux permease